MTTPIFYDDDNATWWMQASTMQPDHVAAAAAAVPTLMIFVLALQGVCIVCTNLPVLAVLVASSELRGTTYVFITNLTLADCLVGVAALLQAIVYARGLSNSGYWCLLCESLAVVACGASIVSFFFVTLERYVTVFNPLRHDAIVTRRRMIAAVVYTWASSGGLMIAAAILLYVDAPRRHCLTLHGGFGSFWMARESLRHLRNMAAEHLSLRVSVTMASAVAPAQAARKREKVKQTLRLLKTLALVIGLFCICWLPLNVVVITFQLCPRHICAALQPDSMIILYSAAMGYLNSFLNVFVYAFRMRVIISELRKMLRVPCANRDIVRPAA
ncbi:PREDICTED: adenosine receptor A2a-like [Priapulus caudatus]|uniref:Adenosine receptor A2a-like n=1 Tax=Priapulus caudatus TaxID=37621 RepID=A0ABM1E9S3_PRICU|nr:PREDICTED: adenosine receptor A2a-like [Priapulus caudatus]